MNGRRVLVVDDDRDFADSLAEYLQDNDHDVWTAYSGAEAIELAAAERFDLILIDIRMPEMSGVESFLAMRNRRTDVPVIMMTAQSAEDVIKEALRHGAADVLHKPFDPTDVLDVLAQTERRRLILIVEDNEDLARSTDALLSSAGYSVAVETSGEGAVERVRRGGVDVVLLDLRLPQMSGFDVATELRRSGNDVPMIVVTGFRNDEADTLAQFDSAGVFDKPVAPEALLALIGEVSVVDP